jgi:hypothetical protein
VESPIVVDRVKGFSRVKKKTKTLDFFLNPLKKILVDSEGVIKTVFPPEEALLTRLDKL